MNFRHKLGSLSRSEDGTIAVISAIAMTVVIGFAAIAVDVGSIHFDNRRLQGATDLAAIAAASNTTKATDAARSTFTDNGGWTLNSLVVETGNYDPSSAKPVNQRFVANQLPINAARVVAQADSPIYFAHVFRDDDVNIAATAIATRPAEAAFSIGSRLLSLEGGIINAILGKMLGGNVSLTVMDYRSLADINIDLLKFMDQLAVEADIEAGTYQQVLDADLTAGKVLSAMAETARDDSHIDAAEALDDLAHALSSTTPVDLARLLNVGKAANAEIGTSSQYGLAAAVNALQMVNTLALVSNGTHQVDVNLGATIPGLTNTQLSVVIGEPPQGTSWITVGEKGAFVRTAQTRIKLTVEVGGTGLLAATKIKLPIFVDIAYAEGRLSAITCGATPASHSVTIATQPGILNAWIGDVTNFTAVNDTPSVNTAEIVNLAGVVRITANAHINSGNMTAKNLVFSGTDIAGHVYKTAVTQDYSQSLASSLVNQVTLTAKVLNVPDLLGIVANQYKALVRTLLTPVTPTLDTILYTTLTTLGIRLGEADVTVHGVRCNNAVVVQ